MAMARRDDHPDPLGPILLYLWQKKWFVIAPALLIFAGTYTATYSIPEEFEVSAEIYSNRLIPYYERLDPPNPNSAAQLIQSNAVLRKVRDEYVEKFKVPPPVFERFAKQFKVKTEILQDTSVRKDISPVIRLGVQSKGKEETHFLMQSWIRNTLLTYGNYATQESVDRRDTLAREDRNLEERLQKAEQELAESDTALAVQEKLLAENLSILAPAEPGWKKSDEALPSSMQSGNYSGTGGKASVNLALAVGTNKQGILSRLVDAGIRLRTETELSTSPKSETLARLKAETTQLQATASDLQTTLAALQSQVRELQVKRDRAQRHVHLLEEEQANLRRVLNKYTVEASLFKKITSDLEKAGGDLRALSDPVMPELKVWPKRTIISAALAFATTMICIFMLLVHRYLSKLEASAKLGSLREE